ncbi:YwqG family protein [Oscillatoria sp. FACHB-1406]|uniref:YwqG family protein n=1 Tax=Oscillatoria sp. FACHB-1406 TaxID=2692846 RepID=UPI0016825187|nr:YwqG family protein [Oscillatoria sp. FACHB-1406]MBD2580313.1 DUF1963 domain-containing protein [Oscillatoria sp. FACHB-1406]
MDDEFPLEVSENLKKYCQEIEATMKPYLEIEPIPNDNTTLWQSKFGGFPYYPVASEYPRSPQGNYLYLLAQINFSEVPPLDNFPDRGILQFYINDDDLYGCDFDEPTKQEGFRVIYFPEIELQRDRLIQDFSFLAPPENFPLPFNQAFSLKLSRKTVSLTTIDEESGEIFSGAFIEEGKENEEFEEYLEANGEEMSSSLHRLGGYPNFTQNDPRDSLPPEEEPYSLLLQIDSECEKDIMWGDVGIGNFFIQESALKKLDFSHVLYNWDCG